MEANIKAVSFSILLALIFVGCCKLEKILPKQEGLWEAVSIHHVSYRDNTLLTEATTTDSAYLFQVYFDKDGSGYTAGLDGMDQNDFTWFLNDAEDVMSIRYSTGSDFLVDILESDKDSFTWFETFISGTDPPVFRVENTVSFVRKE